VPKLEAFNFGQTLTSWIILGQGLKHLLKDALTLANLGWGSLQGQLFLGQNIATTHSIYKRVVPLIRDGLLDDYDIIIDEVPEVVRMVTSKSKRSIQEFYVDAGYMDVDPVTGLVRPTAKW